jgi:hypothetical protein
LRLQLDSRHDPALGGAAGPFAVIDPIGRLLGYRPDVQTLSAVVQ